MRECFVQPVVETGVGRLVDLETPAPMRTITGPADYLSRYGRFGATTAGGHADPEFWTNLTMSPDLPSVARVIGELYPQSGGTAIDGVLVVDPFALQGLVGLTGPLRLEKAGITLTTDNIVPFLLTDQYRRFADDADRQQALTELATKALAGVLTQGAPSPAQLASNLGPALRTGHLQIWSLTGKDQPDLRSLGVSGELPRPTGDGLAVTLTNAAPNKIDPYLAKAVRYRAVIDQRSGQVEGHVTVTLTNRAPSSGLPAVVIGNAVGAPSGTNIDYVSVYTPLQLVSATINGVREEFVKENELGWHVYSRFVRIPPGATTTLDLVVTGQVNLKDGYTLMMRPQPAATPEGVVIEVKTRSGRPILLRRQRLESITLWTSPMK